MRIALAVILLLPALLCRAQLTVATFSGTGSAGFVNGPGDSAQFNQPAGICTDGKGNVFIADSYNNCIRKVDEQGNASTFAGTGIAGFLDGQAATARFNQPFAICYDGNGSFFVADFLNHRIRKIDASGIVSTIAGAGVAGLLDGPGSTALFNYPRGIAIDGQGNLYVGDSWNHRIRKIDTSGMVSTLAGSGTSTGVGSSGGLADGPGNSALFWTPCGLSNDGQGNIYVADAYNHRIRKIDPQGNAITIAGSGISGNGSGGFADGPALSALLNTPTEVFCNAKGDILIGDTYNNRARKLSNGQLTTMAGTGQAGYLNGPDTLAMFNFPRGILCNTVGDSVFVADKNHCIRLIRDSILSAIPFITGLGTGNSLTIFPNPASSQVTITTGQVRNKCTIEIFDSMGKLRFCREYGTTARPEFDVSELQNGVYLIKVSAPGYSASSLLVVQH